MKHFRDVLREDFELMGQKNVGDEVSKQKQIRKTSKEVHLCREGKHRHWSFRGRCKGKEQPEDLSICWC